ncbi:unnamed protein product [Boreogadus saida]
MNILVCSELRSRSFGDDRVPFVEALREAHGSLSAVIAQKERRALSLAPGAATAAAAEAASLWRRKLSRVLRPEHIVAADVSA